MRLTVNLEDDLGRDVRRLAEAQGISMSRLAGEAFSEYVRQLRRREFGQRVLDMAGRVVVAENADAMLEEGRCDDAERGGDDARI
ncbi:hypothetical protein G3N56_04210 [Desulfovibrio sulfodismutans]|uniref:CopG family transcriptional regulator n=1 Tax=Desulfolutivibrio sulfodismutans TaxID=63561 RepID=A0A7K3NIM3_9BACT|nr:hypothetical protein [Desulfolutivibrio sulfodismutans]NDY55947.1 hypothetical protein [Desulfolutivibrio sulfodismutans]